MTSPACPTDAELAAFHCGDLPAAAVDRVADHLERCPTCDARLNEFDQRTDPILHALRQKTVIDPSGADPARFAPTQAQWELTQPAETAPLTDVPGYELLEQIGQGGMGVVYKARHRKLKRLVALKRLRTGTDWDRERFRTEAEAVARLQHPNIVQIYEVGELDGLPYLALEYVEGGTLSELIAGKPQPARPAADLVRTLARAMQYAHDRGVVHRDLKPANILLKTGGKKDRDTLKNPYTTTSLAAFVLSTTPKIADFGIAKCLDESSGQTIEGDVLGTPSYMAPEQARGRSRQVGPATDVYALGAVLYELTTGRPPFDGEHPLETVRQVLGDDPVPPSRLQPRLPRDLETITLKCLQKEAAKRYPTAGALSDDLDRFLDGRPITARPTPFWERLARWARRRPREAVLSGAVAASICAGLAVIAWQLGEAVTAQRTADAIAQQERTVRQAAERREARLAFDRGSRLCEQGDVGHGLLWLARALDRADRAGAEGVAHALRVNLADWGRQLASVTVDPTLPAADIRMETAANDVAIGSDGLSRLTAHDDGRARLVGPDGKPLHELRHGDQPVSAVAFVPPDGRRLLTASRSGGVRVWDGITGKDDGWLTPEWLPVSRLAVSVDGNVVLAATTTAAHLWDFRTRRPLGQPLPHTAPVLAVAISPDGRLCATGDDAGRVRCWSVATRQPVGPIVYHDDAVRTLRFSQDGRRLTVGGGDGKARLQNVPGPPTVGTPTILPRPMRLASFSADGAWLLTGAETEAYLWATNRPGQPVGPYRLEGQPITALALSADGRRLALGGATGGLRVWDRDAGPMGNTLSLPSAVTAMGFRADGAGLLALVSQGDGSAAVLHRWDFVNAFPQERPWEAPVVGPRCFAVSPSGGVFAVGCDDGKVRFIDWPSGRPTGRDVDIGEVVMTLAFSGDGRTLAAGDRNGGVALVETDERSVSGSCRTGRDPVRTLAFGSDGSILAGGTDGSARFWDVHTGLPLGEPVRHEGAVLATGRYADGRGVWGVGRDQALVRWRTPGPIVGGTPEQLRCWVELLAGAALDDDGVPRRLIADQRRERQERLNQLGGPPKM